MTIAPNPTPPTPPAPTPKGPKPPTKTQILNRTNNDIGAISLPSFTSDTGAVVMLIVFNLAWSVFRTFAENPEADNTLGAASSIHGQLVKITTGAWVVGLGLLIVHEIDPHVAMLLALLFLIGNILSNNVGNKAAINALNTLFAGSGPAQPGSAAFNQYNPGGTATTPLGIE